MDEKWAKSRKSSICLYKFDKLLLRTCAEVLKSHFPLSVLNIYLLNLTKTSFEVPKCPLCTKTPVAALYENVGHRFVLEPLLVCGDGQVYRWGWAGVSVDCVARRQHCDLYWEWGAGRGEPTDTEMCSRKKRNESQRYQDRKNVWASEANGKVNGDARNRGTRGGVMIQINGECTKKGKERVCR